jgi:NitT/TauT family transport system substrate-binding protein
MLKRIRLLLNSGFAGPHAGLLLADERGYFRDEGLEITWLEGDGAAAVLPAAFDGSADIVYGDLCALVPLVAECALGAGPASPFVAFNRTPLTIAVRRDGPVQRPADLRGRRVSGHARDAALILFPAYAVAAGIDPLSVVVGPNGASLAHQVRDMVENDAADGVFGFVNTIIASLAEAGLAHLEDRIAFLEYASLLPDFCGNALIASRALIDASPDAPGAAARAAKRGCLDAFADPEAGLAAIARRKPGLNIPVQLQRWRGTIAIEMRPGVDDQRLLGRVDLVSLDRATKVIAEALECPRTPMADELLLSEAQAPRNKA